MKYNINELINALDDYIKEQTAKGKDWRDKIAKTKPR